MAASRAEVEADASIWEEVTKVTKMACLVFAEFKTVEACELMLDSHSIYVPVVVTGLSAMSACISKLLGGRILGAKVSPRINRQV